ncbi:MAG: hypothetical protein AB8U25_07285 [Rickettsiales endosymbiont of Dermacentor nuttalli]
MIIVLVGTQSWKLITNHAFSIRNSNNQVQAKEDIKYYSAIVTIINSNMEAGNSIKFNTEVLFCKNSIIKAEDIIYL